MPLAALMLAATLAHAGPPSDPPGPGWAGPDLATAQALAASSQRPILVFVQRRDCPRCERLEQWLTRDPEIAPLTEPFIRLRVSLDDPQGRGAAVMLKAPTAPTVLMLGPGGMEATRNQGPIPRHWLVEQLQIVVRRHQPDPEGEIVSREALQTSLERLQAWGDLDGAERVRERLAALSATPLPASSALVPESGLEIDTEQDLAEQLDRLSDPAELRARTHEVALILEREGRSGMSLAAYRHTLHRLTVDPLTQARAAFMVTRQNLPVEPMRQHLAQAREKTPDAVPLLMAQARLEETSGRIYMAYHSVETAAVYAPDDAWVNLELRRLRLLVRMRGRGVDREPT